jgi:UDP-N-acetylglucosamine diphosphorylase / glucose-1-phosphate thymidylyltransferase / UDP-N-acetylgalactosamine diphosphorylase / glucosamine-1-phosphate N-acetyltransferase / galactosamine-1-phosphate N-acetyltransferase
MKVVIAAAGQGTRMLHLTKNKCKPLIRVNERPFLAYLLDNLIDAGYSEIILVAGYKADQIEEFVKKEGYKAKVVNQFEILGPKEKIYGTACPIMCVKDIVKNSRFLFLCGDNFYSISDLKGMAIDDNYNYIAALKSEHPEKYGVLIHDNGFLKEIVEKPKEFVGNLINSGMYKFTPEIFEKLSRIKKSPRGEYEITDAVTLLAKEGKVKIKELKDYWIDFGNPGDIIKLSRFLNSKEKK